MARPHLIDCDTCGRPIKEWHRIAVLRIAGREMFTLTHAGTCTLEMLDHLAVAHGLVPPKRGQGSAEPTAAGRLPLTPR